MPRTDSEPDATDTPRRYPPVPYPMDVVRLPRAVLWLTLAVAVAVGWLAWEVRAIRLRAERDDALWRMREYLNERPGDSSQDQPHEGR